MPVTPKPEAFKLARFKPLQGPDRGTDFEVHFNPASLQYTVANTQDPQRRNAGSVQFVSQTTAKLTMDLVFDTTLTGVDVRVSTDKMAKLLRPYQDGGGKIPPSVEFSWGLYTFTGIVEQYKETLDYFSADGVPLRSSINLTLSSNAVVFDSTTNPKAKVDGAVAPEPVVVPDSASPSSATGGVSPSSLANALGDPRAARAIASLSGSASLRFGEGSLAVAGSVSLSPSSAISAGRRPSVGSRVGIGAGAGLGIAATAGAAFAGLHVGTSASASRGAPNVQALLPAAGGTSGASAGFALGGAAHASQGGSLSADVGASANLSARIGFSD